MQNNSIITNNVLQWNLTLPAQIPQPGVVIIIPGWVYGLLPLGGPGLEKDVWFREKKFIDEVTNFFFNNGLGVLTLSFSTDTDDIPSDAMIHATTHIPNIYITIKNLMKEHSCNLNKSVLFGHGFGVCLMCELVSYGLKPAGYIIASGVYTDVESVLTQKYFPFKDQNLQSAGIEKYSPVDPDTSLIMKNLGKLLQAVRKGRDKIKLRDADHYLELTIPKRLFSDDSSPSALLSALDAPSVILHGSGDLDISVINAFFLETKLKQKNDSVSRIVMLDRDHWFREMPDAIADRIRERLSGECINHPVDHRFLKNSLIFIEDVLKIRRPKKKMPDPITSYNSTMAVLTNQEVEE